MLEQPTGDLLGFRLYLPNSPDTIFFEVEEAEAMFGAALYFINMRPKGLLPVFKDHTFDSGF